MLVQIFASSAWTGVVSTTSDVVDVEQLAADLGRALADAADDLRQRVDLLEELAGGDALGRVGDEEVLADLEAALALQVAGDELGRARARSSSAGRREWPGSRTRSRSSSAERMSRMSISMCENDGVPIVRMMWRARAASATRSETSRPPDAWTRRHDLVAAGLLERHAAVARRRRRRSASRSTPTTLSPRSASERASGRPTRPSPMTETSRSTACGI